MTQFFGFWFCVSGRVRLRYTAMGKVSKHIIFSGRVQGVGFRFTAHRIAMRYELTGFVRNLRDGTVEMVAEGPQEDVTGCIEDIRESFTGYVREVQINDSAGEKDYYDFRITF